MPVYIYACRSCGEQLEVTASLAEKEKGLTVVCRKCGSDMAQVFGNVFIASSAFGSIPPSMCGPSCSCNRKER